MQLISEVLQLFYRKTAFQKRPCINPRRGVTLKINNIAFLIFSPCPKKVIEANLIQCRRRGIGRNMPPNAFLQTVGSYDHSHSIPTNNTLDATFDLPASGKGRVFFSRDGIDVRCIGRERQFHSGFLCVDLELPEKAADSPRSSLLQYMV